jgi:hypothetical protein
VYLQPRRERSVVAPTARHCGRHVKTNGNIRADASDGVGVGNVSLFVNGRLAENKYAAPYAFSWAPKRKGSDKLEVRASDAAGNVGRKAVTVAAAHRRRGEATTPSGWLFTQVRPKHAR